GAYRLTSHRERLSGSPSGSQHLQPTADLSAFQLRASAWLTCKRLLITICSRLALILSAKELSARRTGSLKGPSSQPILIFRQMESGLFLMQLVTSRRTSSSSREMVRACAS